MKLSQQQHGAVTLLKPDGPVVEGELLQLTQTLQAVVARTLGRVVLDMSAVPFIDSAGLEALLDASDELNSVGRSLKLCALNKTVRQVLDLTEIESNFELYEDVNSAVRSFL